MTLTSLVQDLRQAPADEIIRYEEDSLNGRVIFPADVEPGDVKLLSLNREEQTSPKLKIEGFCNRSQEEVQPVINELVKRARAWGLNGGRAYVSYHIFWTPESFQNETALLGLFREYVDVESQTHTCDPSKTRIFKQGENHTITATTHSNKMTLRANGNYRKHLAELIERFKPEYAKVELSDEDAGRILRTVRRNSGRIIANILERNLRPKGDIISHLLGRGIEIQVDTAQIERLEEALGKPLVDMSPKQKSRVSEFVKIYGL